MFCGFAGKLTGEHVFPKWLRKIGLDLQPMSHVAGPLNRNLTDLGVSSPFNRTIRGVCEDCNNGWMSDLEARAKQILMGPIQDSAATFREDGHAVIGAWVQKTGLVGALFASRVPSASGRGVPATEYREFFGREDRCQPLPATQVWVGRYEGHGRTASIWVTPMIVEVSNIGEPRSPQAYLVTVQLGPLLLQGLRFVTPRLYFDVDPGNGFTPIWPSNKSVDWPGRETVDDEAFVTTVVKGLHLRSEFRGVRLNPWPEATDLPRGIARNGEVEVMAPCGSHHFTCPAELVELARQGSYHWFKQFCPCGTWYLVRTDRGRFRIRAIGSSAQIDRAYDALPGKELSLHGAPRPFVCKAIQEGLPS